MRLLPPEIGSRTVPLADVEWGADALRLLMQHSLARCKAGPYDLMRAWDKSGDGVLSLTEWLREVRGRAPPV